MSQLKDYRGVATTVASKNALDLYEKALVLLQSYKGDPVELVDAAIAEDPNFVMAHCLRAHCGSAMADGGFSEHVKESLERAKTAAKKSNDREKLHIAAIERWSRGDFQQSVDLLESVLVNYPRDILALQIAHLSDFYLGDADNLRDRVARVLPQYSEDTPGYGFALGMYAFGLEECNEYDRAEEAGHKALEFNSQDVWAIHAVAHVKEMQGRQQDGIDWYESRERDWALDNEFATHNWWHLALFYLDLQNRERVLDIYDASIANESVALGMIDASSLLWRLHLMQWDVGVRWEVLANKWEKALPHGGFYCFNDCHALMAFVAAERHAQTQEMLIRMNKYAKGENGSAWMIQEVGLPVSNALVAFGEGRYADAVELLLKVRYTANRFGGSHAQRDFISQTLIESAIRAGQQNLARALLAERSAKKPSCALTWQNTARVLDALQCSDEAKAANRRASELLH